VPASFVIMMVLGGVLGLAGVTIPAAEAGIAVSLVVLGGIVAAGRSWSVGAAMGLVGLFAVFHGYAHGVEMPAGADTALYSLGFALGSALLHGAGVALGRIAFAREQAARWAGLTVTLAGLVLALG
jgi:urease accessory protein